MASSRSSRKPCGPRGPTAKWTDSMRTVLHLLNEKFDFEDVEKAMLFSEIFKKHLQSCKMPDGIPWVRLRAQYAPSEREKDCWLRILQPTRANIEAQRLLLQQIKATAASVQLITATSSRSTITQRKRPILEQPFTPSATQARKRDVSSIDDEILYESDTPEPPTKRRRIQRAPAVVVLRQPVAPPTQRTSQIQALTPPSTPRKSTSPKSISHILPDGREIILTEKMYAKAQQDRTPVSPKMAHPRSDSGLLFRFWDNESYGLNSTAGFRAGRYKDVWDEVPPPPSCENLPWADLNLHFNKRLSGSIFISTSNNFSWSVHNALKSFKEGRASMRVTIIDQSKLDPLTVFYAAPYVRGLRDKCYFDGDKMRMSGYTEFLVYHEIPGHAIVHTFRIRDLIAFATTPLIRDALHIFDLGQKGELRQKIREKLKSYGVQLTRETTKSLAQLCSFLKIGLNSNIKHISHIVGDVIEGWAWHIAPTSNEGWQSLANTFMFALLASSDELDEEPTLKQQEAIKFAFLYGAKLGCGERNTLHDPKRVHKMDRKARSKGIASPGTILGYELDAAKVQTVLTAARQKKILGRVTREEAYESTEEANEGDLEHIVMGWS